MASEGFTGFDWPAQSTYDEQVGCLCMAPAMAGPNCFWLASCREVFILLPVRSTVGQLPLEQHIGVRIPDGQPRTLPQSHPSSMLLDVPLLLSLSIAHYNQWFAGKYHP